MLVRHPHSYVLDRIFRGHCFGPHSPRKMADFEGQLTHFGGGRIPGSNMGGPQCVSDIFWATTDFITFSRGLWEKNPYVLTRIIRGHCFGPRSPHKMADFEAQLAHFGGGRISGPSMGDHHCVSGLFWTTTNFITFGEVFENKSLCPDQDYSGPLFRPPSTTENGRF